MDQTTTPPTPEGAIPPPPANDVETNKDIAALSYAWVLSVFVYFWKKDSPFVRFHAKQGVVLFILSIIFWVIPVVGRFLELLVLALFVLGFLSAAQGEWKDLPIIGDIAKGRWSHVRQSWRDVVASVARLWKRVRDSIKKEKERGSTPSSTEPKMDNAQKLTEIVDVSPANVSPQPVSVPMPPDQTSPPNPLAGRSSQGSEGWNPNPNPPSL